MHEHQWGRPHSFIIRYGLMGREPIERCQEGVIGVVDVPKKNQAGGNTLAVGGVGGWGNEKKIGRAESTIVRGRRFSKMNHSGDSEARPQWRTRICNK